MERTREERDKIVSDWYVAKLSKGASQQDFCDLYGIGTRQLRHWIADKNLRELEAQIDLLSSKPEKPIKEALLDLKDALWNAWYKFLGRFKFNIHDWLP